MLHMYIEAEQQSHIKVPHDNKVAKILRPNFVRRTGNLDTCLDVSNCNAVLAMPDSKLLPVAVHFEFVSDGVAQRCALQQRFASRT